MSKPGSPTEICLSLPHHMPEFFPFFWFPNHCAQEKHLSKYLFNKKLHKLVSSVSKMDNTNSTLQGAPCVSVHGFCWIVFDGRFQSFTQCIGVFMCMVMPLLFNQEKELTLLGWGSAFGLTIWVPGGIMPLGGSLTSTSKPASKKDIHSSQVCFQNINEITCIRATLCYVSWLGLES